MSKLKKKQKKDQRKTSSNTTKYFSFGFFHVNALLIGFVLIGIIFLLIHSRGNAKTSLVQSKSTTQSSWSSRVMAWIYPGDPGCNAPNEYKDGRVIDTLKPQYFTLQSDGTLLLLTPANAGCNAYTKANAQSVKSYSNHQYITVSGNTVSLSALVASTKLQNVAISSMLSFLKTTGFTGMEIDFEQYSQWTPQTYAEYKTFLTNLGNTLHKNGYKLMVDGPAVIADASNPYPFHYVDFNSLPVDYIVVMEYDWQYTFGAGTPVAPLSRMQDVTQGVLGIITNKSRVVIGMPSYGYHGIIGSTTNLTLDNYQRSRQFPGFSTATRDASSGEMMFSNNGYSYVYSDSTSMNTKRTLLESVGAQYVSVWSLGGNQWFSGKTEPK